MKYDSEYFNNLRELDFLKSMLAHEESLDEKEYLRVITKIRDIRSYLISWRNKYK